MIKEQMKCIKGESCLYCGSIYCRFVDEVNELTNTLEDIKSLCYEQDLNSNFFASEVLEKVKKVLNAKQSNRR